MAAPRPRRKRCSECGYLVDVLFTMYGTLHGHTFRMNVCEQCRDHWLERDGATGARYTA